MSLFFLSKIAYRKGRILVHLTVSTSKAICLNGGNVKIKNAIDKCDTVVGYNFGSDDKKIVMRMMIITMMMMMMAMVIFMRKRMVLNEYLE